MKKLLVASAIALFAFVNAQTEKGSWVVSGRTGIGFNSATTKFSAQGQSVDGPEVSSFSITPSAGCFVINNLAVGLDLSYTSTKTTFNNDELDVNIDNKQQMFAVLPNATYNFATASAVRPYVGAGIGYASVTGTSTFDEKESTRGGLMWAAKGGIVYLVNSTIGLDLGVGYNSFQSTESVQNTDIKTTVNTLAVAGGISFFFK